MAVAIAAAVNIAGVATGAERGGQLFLDRHLDDPPHGLMD
jgi:hypothetical protein